MTLLRHRRDEAGRPTVCPHEIFEVDFDHRLPRAPHRRHGGLVSANDKTMTGGNQHIRRSQVPVRDDQALDLTLRGDLGARTVQ